MFWRLAKCSCVALVFLAVLTVGASEAGAHGSYTVKPGDTLSEIAQQHEGVSVAEIMLENLITNPNLIRIGQKLSIPHAGGTSDSAAPAPTSQAPAAASGSYTVKSGDTLSRIGSRLGVPWKQLAVTNGLTSPYRLRVGQVLRVPSGAANYPALPTRILDDPARVELIGSFEKWSGHYGVPTDLLMALAYQESGWQNSLTSSAGAMGVGQIMPATAEWLKTSIVRDESLDPWVADDNIRLSAGYLSWLTKRLGTSQLAIAAYYQGQGSIEAGKYYDETRRYVANVEAQRRLFVHR